MIVIYCRYGFAALLMLAFVTGGCVSKWGNMPPYTYSGKVINGVTKASMGGVELTASRRAFKRHWWPMIASERIGSSVSAEDGSFSLTTSGGYPQYIEGLSDANVRYLGGVGIEQDFDEEIIMQMNLCIGTYTVNYERNDSADVSNGYRDILYKIVKYHELHGNTSFQSINKYRELAVISDEELSFLAEHEQFFLNPDSGKLTNKVFASWGQQRLVYGGLDSELSFEENRSLSSFSFLDATTP